MRYYGIPAQFARLVDSDELRAWEEDIYQIYPNETNQMVMKRFIQDFNISREDFEKANYEFAEWISIDLEAVAVMNPKDYINQGIYEVYNGDIIYTFDDEIINEYYLSGDYMTIIHQ